MAPFFSNLVRISARRYDPFFFQVETAQFDSCNNFLKVSVHRFLIMNSVKEQKDDFSNQRIFYESLY